MSLRLRLTLLLNLILMMTLCVMLSASVQAQNSEGSPHIFKLVISGCQFRPSTTRIQTGWARPLLRNGSLGLSGKIWREDRDRTASNGWAVDAGILFKRVLPLLNTDVGLAIRNLGPAVDGDDLPTTLALGAASHIQHPSFFRHHH